MVDDTSVSSVPSIPAVIKTSAHLSTLIDPRHGGRHPILASMGGDTLDENYNLESSFSYSNISQIRSERSLNIAETALHAQRSELTSSKFNGTIDVSEGDPSTLSELNTEGFLRVVGDMVERFGMQSFFYLLDSLGVIQYLPEEPHTFSLAQVQATHTSHLSEPAAVTNAAGDETSASLLAWFKCYDLYEQCDFSLSRLTIEALTHPDLRAQVVVQYGTGKSFKRLPGQVYQMMILQVCHASFAVKLEEVATSTSLLW